MQFEYLLTSSKASKTIKDEVEQLFIDFSAQVNKALQKRIVRLTIFYAPSKDQEIEELIRAQIANVFNDNPPTFSLLAQPPYCQGKILIETCYTNNPAYQISHHTLNKIPYSIARSKTEEHLFVSGARTCSNNATIQKHSEDAFEQLNAILKKENFSYKHIVRQWNYIEDIISVNDKRKQHYQIFNDVRTKYYNEYGLISDFPAATGIGIKEAGVIIEVHAIKSNKVTTSEVKNPEQTDAFNYSQEVLEGLASAGLKSRSTPKFARGRRINYPDYSHLYISGTASIIGEETVGIGDIRLQTATTLENILKLTDTAINNEKLNYQSAKNNYLRVYVKTTSDMPTVEAFCKKAFPNTTCIIVEADICRSNLLVEIEGALGLFNVN